MAKIYDIDDEDIQKDYIGAFNGVVFLYDELKEDYEKKALMSFPRNFSRIIKMLLKISNQNLKFKLKLPLIWFYWYFNKIATV